PVLRGDLGPDVPDHRRVGEREPRLRRDQVLPVHDGRVGFLAGRHPLPVCTIRPAGAADVRSPAAHAGGRGASGPDGALALPRVLRRVRGEGTALPLTHLAPGRSPGSADRWLRSPRGCPAEGRHVRTASVQPQHVPASLHVLRHVRLEPRGDRDHLRRPVRVDPDRSQAARGVLERVAPGIRRAGHLRVHATGGDRRRAPDGQSRPRDRRPVPAGRHGLRTNAHARARGHGRARQRHARPAGRVPVRRVRERRVSRAELVRRGVPGDHGDVRGQPPVRGSVRDRRGAGRDLSPMVVPACRLRTAAGGAPPPPGPLGPGGGGARAGARLAAGVRRLPEAPHAVDRPGHLRRDRAGPLIADVCGHRQRRGSRRGRGTAAVIPTPALEFRPILPEILLCTFAIVGMLYEAFARRPDPVPHLAIAIVGIGAAAVTAYALWDWGGPSYVLGDTVAVDRFSVVSRFVLLGAAFVGCLYYTHYASRDPGSFRGEFYPLTLFATAGMTLITAAND